MAPFRRDSPPSPERIRLLLLVGIAVAVYINTLGHYFVYDDFEWVLENRAVRHPEKALEFFTSGQLQNRVYRPLALLSFSLDYAVAGLRPWFFHAENVLLHAAVTVLVYRLLLPAGNGTAWLAAALFAVMPVHTEVVANVTARSELLAALFGLLALLQMHRPAAAAALLLLAMLSKETAVAIPALVPLLWWRQPRRPSAARMAAGLGMLATALAVYLLLRNLAHCCVLFPSDPITYKLDNPLIFSGWLTRLRTGLMILGQNLAVCLVPYHLSADYSFPQILPVTGWLEPRFLFWSALPLLAVVAVLSIRRTHPNFAWGLGWFLVSVAPVSNILLLIGTIRAERLLYLPSVGTSLIAAEAAGILVAGRRRWRMALAALLLLALGVMSAKRNLAWLTMETIVTATAADAPQSAKAQYDLGEYHMFERDCAAAVPRFRRALELFPEFRVAALNLGTCLEWTGDLAAAEKLYRQMLERNPGDRLVAGRLMRICARRGDERCASAVLGGVLNANPDAAREARLWVMLGEALVRSGEEGEAEAAFRRAASLGGTPGGHFGLAELLARQERFHDAVREYEAAARSGANTEQLWVGWAAAQRRAGDRRGARETAARGLRSFPASQALKELAR